MSIHDNPLVQRAREYATEAHTGKTRKYDGAPYIVHPLEVAELVAATRGATPEMVAAAYLHDVLEDTPVLREHLEEDFGKDVADLVWWLTDVSCPEDGNRASRKAKDRAHIAEAPKEAHTIKLADLISNSRSILDSARNGDKDAKAFAKVYIREKKMLLGVLHGDMMLTIKACAIIDNYLDDLQEK